MHLSTQAKFVNMSSSAHESLFRFLQKSEHSSPSKCPTSNSGDHIPNHPILMFSEFSWPDSQKLHNLLRHNPRYPKKCVHHTPQLPNYWAMQEQMIYGLPCPFTYTIPINNNKPTLPQIVIGQNPGLSHTLPILRTPKGLLDLLPSISPSKPNLKPFIVAAQKTPQLVSSIF